MFSALLKTFVIILLLLASQTVLAEKTDVVFLQNGDRITGEAKSLFRGKLEFSTDHMGTLFIEWNDIAEIRSTIGQAIELTNGQRFFGPLAKTEDSDMLMVETSQGDVGLSTLDVISMYPVEAGFWERLDLSASLGFSWDKGSKVGKYSLGVDANYRRQDSLTRVGFTTELTTQEIADDTARSVFDASHIVFRKHKKFRIYFGNMEHNDQLGIDLRTLAGAGYGWVPIRNQRNWFGISAGLAANHEIPSIGDAETNLEAVGAVSYEYFKFDNPERSFKVNFTIFPSLTDFGRWRANFTNEFKLEFVEDLFWKMDIYANYDSDPISSEGASSDYGVTSAIGYKF
jgi:hypothetical protein